MLGYFCDLHGVLILCRITKEYSLGFAHSITVIHRVTLADVDVL